jgi:GTPase Era involved in 16S rRNA processing
LELINSDDSPVNCDHTVSYIKIMEVYNARPTILLWGDSGTGKSAFVNCIADKDIAVEGTNGSSCTIQPKIYRVIPREEVKGFAAVNLIDTRGIHDAKHVSDLEIMQSFVDYMLESSESPLLWKFDALLFLFNAGERKTDHIITCLKEFNETFCSDADQKSIIIVLTMCGDFADRTLQERVKYFKSQLPHLNFVVWDSHNNIPGQFEELSKLLKAIKPFDLHIAEKLKPAIEKEAEELRIKDVVPVLIKNDEKASALPPGVKTIHNRVTESHNFLHVEKTSGYGVWTILSFCLSKLATRSEKQWFYYTPDFNDNDVDRNVKVISVEKGMPSEICKGISEVFTHRIEGTTIIFGSEMTFRATAFGQYKMQYTVVYTKEFTTVEGFKLKPGETVSYFPKSDLTVEYLKEAKTRTLVRYFQEIKKRSNEVLKVC